MELVYVLHYKTSKVNDLVREKLVCNQFGTKKLKNLKKKEMLKFDCTFSKRHLVQWRAKKLRLK